MNNPETLGVIWENKVPSDTYRRDMEEARLIRELQQRLCDSIPAGTFSTLQEQTVRTLIREAVEETVDLFCRLVFEKET